MILKCSQRDSFLLSVPVHAVYIERDEDCLLKNEIKLSDFKGFWKRLEVHFWIAACVKKGAFMNLYIHRVD